MHQSKNPFLKLVAFVTFICFTSTSTLGYGDLGLNFVPTANHPSLTKTKATAATLSALSDLLRLQGSKAETIRPILEQEERQIPIAEPLKSELRTDLDWADEADAIKRKLESIEEKLDRQGTNAELLDLFRGVLAIINSVSERLRFAPEDVWQLSAFQDLSRQFENQLIRAIRLTKDQFVLSALVQLAANIRVSIPKIQDALKSKRVQRLLPFAWERFTRETRANQIMTVPQHIAAYVIIYAVSLASIPILFLMMNLLLSVIFSTLILGSMANFAWAEWRLYRNQFKRWNEAIGRLIAVLEEEPEANQTPADPDETNLRSELRQKVQIREQETGSGAENENLFSDDELLNLDDKVGIEQMPAWALLESLGLENPETVDEQYTISTRAGPKGTQVKRILIPKPSTSPPQGLDFLYNELAPTRQFDLLYNRQGYLIAIFPVPTFKLRLYDWLRHQLFQYFRSTRLGWGPGYLDLSPYYFVIPSVDDFSADLKWHAFSNVWRANQKVIQAFETEQSEQLGMSFEPYSSLGHTYSYVEFSRPGNGPFNFDVDFFDPHEFGPEKTTYDSAKMQFIIPHFPSVYTSLPESDAPFMAAVQSDPRFDLQKGHRLLVVGPGGGIDSILGVTVTQSPVTAVGINQFEIANLNAIAHAHSFDVRGIVHNNLADRKGKPVLDEQFDRIMWDMPSLDWRTYPRHLGLQLLKWLDLVFGVKKSAMHYWDGVGEETVERFAKGLMQMLAPNGRALAWNVVNPNLPDDQPDRVAEILRKAGLSVEIDKYQKGIRIYFLTKPEGKNKSELRRGLTIPGFDTEGKRVWLWSERVEKSALTAAGNRVVNSKVVGLYGRRNRKVDKRYLSAPIDIYKRGKLDVGLDIFSESDLTRLRQIRHILIFKSDSKENRWRLIQTYTYHVLARFMKRHPSAIVRAYFSGQGDLHIAGKHIILLGKAFRNKPAYVFYQNGVPVKVVIVDETFEPKNGKIYLHESIVKTIEFSLVEKTSGDGRWKLAASYYKYLPKKWPPYKSQFRIQTHLETNGSLHIGGYIGHFRGFASHRVWVYFKQGVPFRVEVLDPLDPSKVVNRTTFFHVYKLNKQNQPVIVSHFQNNLPKKKFIDLDQAFVRTMLDRRGNLQMGGRTWYQDPEANSKRPGRYPYAPVIVAVERGLVTGLFIFDPHDPTKLIQTVRFNQVFDAQTGELIDTFARKQFRHKHLASHDRPVKIIGFSEEDAVTIFGQHTQLSRSMPDSATPELKSFEVDVNESGEIVSLKAAKPLLSLMDQAVKKGALEIMAADTPPADNLDDDADVARFKTMLANGNLDEAQSILDALAADGRLNHASVRRLKREYSQHKRLVQLAIESQSIQSAISSIASKEDYDDAAPHLRERIERLKTLEVRARFRSTPKSKRLTQLLNLKATLGNIEPRSYARSGEWSQRRPVDRSELRGSADTLEMSELQELLFEAGEAGKPFLSAVPLIDDTQTSRYIEFDAARGIAKLKERIAGSNHFRDLMYLYDDRYQVRRIEFVYNPSDRIGRLEILPGSGTDLPVPFTLNRHLFFTQNEAGGWDVVQMKGSFRKQGTFRVRHFNDDGEFDRERLIYFGLETSLNRNRKMLEFLSHLPPAVLAAVSRDFLKDIYASVHTGETLQDFPPSLSLLEGLHDAQYLGKANPEVTKDLSEIGWVGKNRYTSQRDQIPANVYSAYEIVARLIAKVFQAGLADHAQIPVFLETIRFLSEDPSWFDLLGPNASMIPGGYADRAIYGKRYHPMITAIRAELLKRKRLFTDYDAALLMLISYWEDVSNLSFHTRLFQIADDQRGADELMFKKRRWIAQEMMSAGLYSVVSALPQETRRLIEGQILNYLNISQEEPFLTNQRKTREISALIGYLLLAIQLRHTEGITPQVIIHFLNHPILNWFTGSIKGFLFKHVVPAYKQGNQEEQERIIRLLKQIMASEDAVGTILAAAVLIEIGVGTIESFWEVFERLRSVIPADQIVLRQLLHHTFFETKNHRILQPTVLLEKEYETLPDDHPAKIEPFDKDYPIDLFSYEHELGILKSFKDQIAEKSPDEVIEELADHFIYRYETEQQAKREAVVETLRKFAYTPTGFDEFETVYFLYALRPVAGQIRADLFLERFGRVSGAIAGMHVLMGPIFVDLFGAREKNGYPIIPDARFEGLLSSMKSHMGDEETPGLLWFREVLEKSSSRNWTLMLAAASHILLKGNLKEDVYEVGNASLPSQYQDKIEYESFLNLNPTEPVRDAFFRLEAKLQNGDRTRFGSYLKEKTGYSLRDFKKDPKLFAVYADELVQAMADFPFEAPGEAGILLNGLEYRRGKGIEFSFISRNADDFRLGNCVGDCTAYRDAGSHTFWSVATYLSHPFYQTLLVYYDGRLIDKLDLTLIEIEGKIYLNIDAHEPIPNLEKSESVSMELLSKREEFFLAAIERVKDIARAMGVAGIRAVGTSNRKYIEGVVRKQKLNGNPEEEKVIIPGLYQKYFGTRAAGVEVRLLGGVDVPNRYVSEQTPLLEPLLTHWRVKPEIFFQATSMGDTSDTLRAFGSYVEQRIQKLHGEEHSQIENLLKDEKFEECVALLLSDKTYKSLTSKISRRHHALGLTEENFREDLKTVLTYIYSPSRIFGTARLYDIPMDSPTGHSELRVQFNKTRADQSSLTEQSTQTNADRAKSHETAALLNQFYDQLLIKGERLAPDAHTFFPITIDLSRYETEISKIRAIKIPYEFKKHIVFKIDHFRSQTEFIRAAMEDITGTLSPFLRALASDEVEVDYTQGESWENLITNWPLWGAETSPHSKAFNFYRNHVDPLIIETIEKQIEKRQKELAERPVVILDLFAGDGSLIERLAHKFQKRWPKLSFKFHIVDTQARLVERARLRLKDLPVQVHQADIPSVIQLSDLINGQADFVIVSGGLAESVISQRNAKLVLQRIYRVLKSGGIALITGYTHILFNRREFKKVYGFQVLQTSIPENVFATEELPDQFYVVQKPIKEEAAPRFRRRVSADDVFAIPRRSELRSAVHVTPEKNGAVTIEIPKALLGKERAVRLEAVLKGRSAHTPLESKGKDSYSFYVPNAYEFQIILEAIGIPSEIQYDKVVSVKGLMLSFFDDWVELRKKPVEEFAQGFTELLINLNRVPQTVRANAAPLRPEVPSEFIASLQRGRSELRHIAAQHSLRRLVEAIRDFIWNLSVRLTPPSLGREISIYFINGPSSTKKIIHPHKRESMAGNLIRLLNRSQALVMIVNPMFVLGYLRGKGPERRFNHSNVSFHLNHVLFKDNQFLKYSIHIFQFFAERVKLATEILQNYSPFALFGIFRSLSWPFAHVGMLAGGASFVNLFLLNKLLIFNQITFPGRLERHRSELRNTLLEKTEIADPNGVPRSEVRANPDETEARVWTNPARYEEFQAGDIWEFKGERHEIVRRLDRSHVFLVRDSQGKPWVLKLFYEREKRRLVQRFLEDVKGKPGIMQGIIYRQSGHDVLKLEFAGDRTLKEFLNEGQAAAMPLAARYQLARDIWMIFQTLTELNYDQGDFGAHNIVLDRLDNDRWKPTLIDEVNLERLGDLTTDDYETRYIEYLDLTHAVLSVIVGYYLVPQDEGEIQAIEPTFGNEIANAVFDWSYLHEKDDRRGKRDVRHLRVLTENVRDLLQSGFTPQAASRAELQSSRAGLTTVRSSQRAAARAELPSASGLEKGRPRTVGPQDTQTSSSLRAELREEKAEKGPWKQLPYYLSIIRSSTSSQTEKLSAIHSIRSGFASYPNTPTDDFIQLFLTEFKRIDSDDFKKEEYREALLRGLLDYGFLPSSAVREEAFRILQSHDWVAFQIVLDGLVSEFPDQITDEWFDLLKERVFGETPIAESILFFFGDILDENAEELQRFKPKIMNDAVFLTRLRTKVDRVLAVQWHALENQPHAGRPSVRSVANTWLLRWALDPSRKPGDKKPNEAALIIVLTARSKSGQKAVLPTGRKFLSRLDGEEIQQLKSVIESERVTPYDLIVHYMREGKRMIFWGYYQMAADRTFKRFSRDLIDLVDNEEITHILLPFYEQEFRDFLTAELSASKANLALASFFGEGNARLFYETFRYLDGKIRFIYKGLGGEKSDTEVFEGEELLLDRSAAALHNLLRTNPKAKILAIGSDWSAIKNHRKTSGTEGEIDLSLAWLLAGRIGSEKVASIFEMDRQALHHVKAQGVNNLIDAIDQFTAIKSFGLPIIRTPVEKLAYDEDYPDDTFGNAIDAIIVRMSDDDDNDEYFIGPDIPEEPEVRPVPGTPASSRTVQLSRAELPHHPIGDGAVPTVIEANSVNSMGRLGLHQPINQDFLELIRKAGAVRSSQRAAARAELPSASGLEKGRPRAVGPQDTQTSSSLRTELRTEQAMEKEPAALQSNRLWWMRLASSFIWGFVVRLIPKSVKTEFNKRRPPARQSEFFQSLPRSLQAAVGGYFISDLVGPKKLIENVMVVVKHKFFDSVDQDKRAEIEYEVSYQLEELYDFLLENQVHYPGFVFTYFVPAIVQWVDSVEDLHRAIGELASYQDFSKIDSLALAFIKLFILKTKTPAEMVLDESNMAQKMAPISAILGMLRASDSVQEVLWLGPQTVQVVQDAVVKMLNGRPLLFSSRFTLPIHWENIFLENWTDIFLKAHQAIHFGKEFAIQTKTNRWGRMAVMDDELEVMPVNQSLSLTGDSAEEARAELRTILILIAQVLALLALPFFVNVILNKWTERSERHKKMQVSEKERVLQEALAQYRSFHNSYLGNLLARSQPSDERTSLLQDAYQKIVQTNSFDHEELRKGSVFGYSPSDLIQRILYNDYVHHIVALAILQSLHHLMVKKVRDPQTNVLAELHTALSGPNGQAMVDAYLNQNFSADEVENVKESYLPRLITIHLEDYAKLVQWTLDATQGNAADSDEAVDEFKTYLQLLLTYFGERRVILNSLRRQYGDEAVDQATALFDQEQVKQLNQGRAELRNDEPRQVLDISGLALHGVSLSLFGLTFDQSLDFKPTVIGKSFEQAAKEHPILMGQVTAAFKKHAKGNPQDFKYVVLDRKFVARESFDVLNDDPQTVVVFGPHYQNLGHLILNAGPVITLGTDLLFMQLISRSWAIIGAGSSYFHSARVYAKEGAVTEDAALAEPTDVKRNPAEEKDRILDMMRHLHRDQSVALKTQPAPISYTKLGHQFPDLIPEIKRIFNWDSNGLRGDPGDYRYLILNDIFDRKIVVRDPKTVVLLGPFYQNDEDIKARGPVIAIGAIVNDAIRSDAWVHLGPISYVRNFVLHRQGVTIDPEAIRHQAEIFHAQHPWWYYWWAGLIKLSAMRISSRLPQLIIQRPDKRRHLPGPPQSEQISKPMMYRPNDERSELREKRTIAEPINFQIKGRALYPASGPDVETIADIAHLFPNIEEFVLVDPVYHAESFKLLSLSLKALFHESGYTLSAPQTRDAIDPNQPLPVDGSAVFQAANGPRSFRVRIFASDFQHWQPPSNSPFAITLVNLPGEFGLLAGEKWFYPAVDRHTAVGGYIMGRAVSRKMNLDAALLGWKELPTAAMNSQPLPNGSSFGSKWIYQRENKPLASQPEAHSELRTHLNHDFHAGEVRVNGQIRHTHPYSFVGGVRVDKFLQTLGIDPQDVEKIAVRTRDREGNLTQIDRAKTTFGNQIINLTASSINIVMHRTDSRSEARSQKATGGLTIKTVNRILDPKTQISHYERFNQEGRQGDAILSYASTDPLYLEFLTLSILKKLPHEAKALSVGEGRGHLAARLKKNGVHMTAMDITAANIPHAKENEVELVIADANQHFPFEANAFDAVIFNESIGAMQLAHVAREAQRVLKPGGVIVIAHYEYKHINALTRTDMMDQTKYVLYTREEVNSALASAGFEEPEVTEVPPIHMTIMFSRKPDQKNAQPQRSELKWLSSANEADFREVQTATQTILILAADAQLKSELRRLTDISLSNQTKPLGAVVLSHSLFNYYAAFGVAAYQQNTPHAVIATTQDEMRQIEAINQALGNVKVNGRTYAALIPFRNIDDAVGAMQSLFQVKQVAYATREKLEIPIASRIAGVGRIIHYAQADLDRFINGIPELAATLSRIARVNEKIALSV